MAQSVVNNKRIAKNAVFMYFRMFLTMAVSLYSSRVVLNTLGITNFGIYNIVGGVVVMFTFISNAMASATQRHISYELGKEDGDVAKIYSVCYNIHAWICLVIFIFAETIGLWFLNYKLNIPAGRMVAANWIYQFSIVSCLLGIIRVPDNAAVIAYERMSFYAYIGIWEAILKLVIVFFLLIFPIDKLILYGFLIMAVTGIINYAYIYYRKRNITEIRHKPVRDKKQYKELLSFSTWTLIGSIATMGRTQGINIIVNMFYGVGLNAAIGVANQVNSQVSNLVFGFQQAFNPQLTKSEACCNREQQFTLICRSSRFSFLLMFVVALPILINLDYILHIWLGTYPEHTTSICRIIITGALIETLSGPLWVTLFATGRIKWYQITVSLILLMILPISYIGGHYGMTAEMMFSICNVLLVMTFITRLIFLKRSIGFNVSAFVKDVLQPIAKILFLISLPLCLIPDNLLCANNFMHFFVTSCVTCAFAVIVVLFAGIHRNERNKLITFVVSKMRNQQKA